MKPRVLVVEDDHERAAWLRRALIECSDCSTASSMEEALSHVLREKWAAVVSSYDVRGGSGLELLQVLCECAPMTLRIAYTRVDGPSLASDFERLVHPHAVLDAREPGFLDAVRARVELLLAAPGADVTPPRGARWVATAPASIEFVERLRRVAMSQVPVFLHGEPGSGKSRAAAVLRRWRQEWRLSGGAASPGVPQVAVLRVPPLRERAQDIPTLARACLEELSRERGQPPRTLAREAVAELMRREWRGNIIELQATLLRAVQRVGDRPVIGAEDLPHDLQPALRPSQHAKDEGQRECVLRQLRIARNVSGAARLEGCSRANYIRLMRRLGIVRADVVADMEPEEQVADRGAPLPG